MRNLVSIAAVTAVMALTACTGSSPGGSPAPTELDMAAIAPPESFTPGNFGTGPTTLFLQPVYDTLIRNDNEGEPGVNIATEWSYNDAQTELTLTLRDDVTFTDGAALDAEAVKANLEFAK